MGAKINLPFLGDLLADPLTAALLQQSEVVYELPTVCMQVLVIMPQVGVDGLVCEESV